MNPEPSAPLPAQRKDLLLEVRLEIPRYHLEDFSFYSINLLTAGCQVYVFLPLEEKRRSRRLISDLFRRVESERADEAS